MRKAKNTKEEGGKEMRTTTRGREGTVCGRRTSRNRRGREETV